jgi:hypothetical protein
MMEGGSKRLEKLQELQFRGWPVNCWRIPEAHGRWASFFHLVQEGPIEDDRVPDLRRCERIRRVRWVIENAATHLEIDEWHACSMAASPRRPNVESTTSRFRD